MGTVEVESDGEVGKPLFKTMVIKDHTLNYYSEDGRIGNSFTFELDPNKRPRQIDTTSAKSKVRNPGIYTLEHDVLRICDLADATKVDQTRPTELRTSPGSNFLLITYKRKGP
jgi:uncharacterized protein (TIGR03067 family)